MPNGPYIVDFARLCQKLILEIDGGQHSGNEQDLIREQKLKDEGFKVLRFWNNDVLKRTDVVLEIVMTALKNDPRNSPSPGVLRAPPSPPTGEGKRAQD